MYSSLAPIKSRMETLWHWPTQVVLENGRSASHSLTHSLTPHSLTQVLYLTVYCRSAALSRRKLVKAHIFSDSWTIPTFRFRWSSRSHPQIPGYWPFDVSGKKGHARVG